MAEAEGIEPVFAATLAEALRHSLPPRKPAPETRPEASVEPVLELDE
jgi:hypothetical protein